MTNIIDRLNPFKPENRQKVLRGAATLTVAGIALSAAGCGVRAKPEGYMSCTGSQTVPVDNGDTLTGLLVEHSGVEGGGDAKNVALELGRIPQFKGAGELPDFTVHRSVSGDMAPTLAAQTEVDLPEECHLNS